MTAAELEEMRDLRDTCTERLRKIGRLQAEIESRVQETKELREIVLRLERRNELLNTVLDDYAETDHGEPEYEPRHDLHSPTS